jgi:hypothetical protein
MKYTVTATLTKTYEVEVEALDPALAIRSLDGWIFDDFEDYETDASWILEAK